MYSIYFYIYIPRTHVRVSCLQMLELDQIGDRLIGSDEEGGLSLEQRKRTTLGVELAANPSLIFLDGPYRPSSMINKNLV